jgi:hypothetical protein
MNEATPNAEPQSEGRSFRSYFTLKELLAAFITISALLAIALSFIGRSREQSRLDRCNNNCRQIGIALLNYSDKFLHFPPISSNMDPVPDVPGDPTATSSAWRGEANSPGAGRSWIVQILPEMEEQVLYQIISNNSVKLTRPAFDPAIVNGPWGSARPHVATVQLKQFVCPSSAGDLVLDTLPRIVGAPAGQIETGSAPPNYVGGVAAANGAKGIAVTSYNAILGTHIDDVGPAVAPYALKSASLPNSNNGGMLFRGTRYDYGVELSAITDGLSKTPLVVETASAGSRPGTTAR